MVRLKVRKVAEEHGYNMSTLSRKADVSFNTVKRIWYDPDHDASIKVLDKLAMAIEVDLRELYDYSIARAEDASS